MESPLKLQLTCGTDSAGLLFSPSWSMRELLELIQLNFKDAKTVKPHQITLVGAKQSGGVLRVKDVSDLYDGIQIEVVLPEVLSFSPPPVAHHSTKASIPNSPASARIGSGTSSPISGTPPARKKTFMDKLTGNRPRSTSEHSAEIAGFDVSRTQSSGGGTLTDGRPHRLSVHSYKKPTFCDDCQEMLWGLVRQGVKCSECGKNFHKRCAVNLDNKGCKAQVMSPTGALRNTGGVPHSFAVHTYKTLTCCGYCKKLLWGMTRQGMQCEDCGFNVHRKCSEDAPHDCGIAQVEFTTVDADGQPVTTTWTAMLEEVYKTIRTEKIPPVDKSKYPYSPDSDEDKISAMENVEEAVANGQYGMAVGLIRYFRMVFPGDVFGQQSSDEVEVMKALFLRKEMSTGSQIPLHRLMNNMPASVRDEDESNKNRKSHTHHGHVFFATHFNTPTFCQHCREFIWGLARQGYKCQKCGFKCHKRCYNKTKACTGERQQSELFEQREIILEGWLVHQTNKDTNKTQRRKRRYWRLDEIRLCSYVSDMEKQAKDIIPIDEIQGADTSSITQLDFCFEVTTSKCVFLMEAENEAERRDWLYAIRMLIGKGDPDSGMHAPESAESTVPTSASLAAAAVPPPTSGVPATRIDLKAPPSNTDVSVGAAAPAASAPVESPVAAPPPQVAVGAGVPTGLAAAAAAVAAAGSGPRSSVSVPVNPGAPPISAAAAPAAAAAATAAPKTATREPSGADKMLSLSTRNISQDYKLHLNDVLGSGQFGVVVGAERQSDGAHFAVKIIEKKKMSQSKNSKTSSFKNEVRILQKVRHESIVSLEDIYEAHDKIFLVMERVEGGDMLDRILLNPNGKLGERETKFLVVQILVALKYLHALDISHRDLKPENVLLMSKGPFPQAKICDFGFAKVVGENSFMMSIVGTPAYVAPEVLEDSQEGYQRSVDMWSVGVIIYVSLSGTFPFNEDEDIRDQMRNAAFMFPKDVWRNISKAAIHVITCLLKVDPKDRYTEDQTIQHAWMRDKQLYNDCKQLEAQVREDYITRYLRF